MRVERWGSPFHIELEPWLRCALNSAQGCLGFPLGGCVDQIQLWLGVQSDTVLSGVEGVLAEA